MKLFLFILCILFSTFYLNSQNLESQIKHADSLWSINKLDEAITAYNGILKTVQIPVEFQSLMYLRLAEGQFQAKQFANCRQTLTEMSSLKNLSGCHKLKFEELDKRINNLPVVYHKPIPDYTQVALTFYVSQLALETGNGTLKKPFKTIEDALDALQAKIGSSGLPEGALEIVFLDESYIVPKTVMLDKKMSGTKRNPLLIRSFSPQKRTLITGGINIKEWKAETNPEILSLLPLNARNKVKVADLKQNGVFGFDSLEFGGVSSGRGFNTKPLPEFFYEGKVQKISRWPNDKDTSFILQNFRSERPHNWEKEDDIWLHGYWKWSWSDAYEKFGSYDKDTIRLVPPLNFYGFADSSAEYDWMPKASAFHVLNSLAEMDMPGDYKISAAAGKIWYFPNEDFNPGACILSFYSLPFKMDSCQFVTMKDLDIRFFRGDAIIARNCGNYSFINSTVRDVSGIAIQIEGGYNHLLHSSTIQSMGRGGVILVSGDRESLTSSGSMIENCHFSDLSRIDRTYTQALVMNGNGIIVQHCYFENLPGSAIRIEGNDMLIQLNEFTRCVTESGDQGAIDVYGNPFYRGNIIRWNFFHDIGNGAAGVRLDDAICGFCISENIFLRSSSGTFGGVQIHGGKDNLLEGNIFIDGNSMVSQIAWGEKKWLAYLTKHNNSGDFMWGKNYPMNNLWHVRYPELNTNLSEGHDRNFFYDNKAIKIKELYQRVSVEPSDSFESVLFNNSRLPEKNVPEDLAGVEKYLNPWHFIPVWDMGLWKIN